MIPLLKTNSAKTARKTYQGLPTLLVRGLCLPSLCLLVAFAQYASAEGPTHIVKWKDDKGATHYGDRIPAEYANRENSIINQQGITVKRNKPTSQQNVALDLVKQEQDKKDKALLSAFTNENEIDLARDRNLQPDQMALENLYLEKSHIQKRLVEYKKSVDNLIKSKKTTIPTDLKANIANHQAEIARLDQLISQRKSIIENTRTRFDNDKKRYIALKNHTIENNTLPETAPTANLPAKVTEKPANSGS